MIAVLDTNFYALRYHPESSGQTDRVIKSYDRVLHRKLRRRQIKELLRADDRNSITKLVLGQEPVLSRKFSSEELGKLSLLWIAVLGCYEKSAELLVRSGADVNELFGSHHDPQVIDEKWTVLHVLLQMHPSSENERLIRLVTDHGADLRARDSVGRTVLHFAASKGRVRIAEMFLRKGVDDVNIADDKGVTALLAAAASREADELLPLLMKHGADVFAKDNYGRNALHQLSSSPVEHCTDLARVLIEKGVSLDDRDYLMYQPLHSAISCGSTNDMVKLFLDHGADANARANNDCFPLSLAISYSSAQVMQTLLEGGAKVDQRNSYNGRTALHEACRSEDFDEDFDEEKIEVLLRAGADLHARNLNGQTVLHILASTDQVGTTEMFSNFLGKAVDVNITDVEGMTALLVAARSRQADELLPLLMKHGAYVLAKDRRGRNALHHLAKAPVEHTDLARVLINRGVSLYDVDHRDRYQPIHLAVREGKNELVKLYLDHGASANARARDDCSFPLFLAATSPRSNANAASVLKTLLKRGANVGGTTFDTGRTALHGACGENFDVENIKILLRAGANLQTRDFKGQTALHIAASKGRVRMIKIFLRKGLDVNVADAEGVTALHAAAGSRKADELLPLLMKHGADVFAKDNYGRNALHQLSSSPVEHTDLARVLIKRGVSLHDRDRRDRYQPIHLAARAGKNELVKLYLDHGANANARAHCCYTPLYLAAVSREGNAALVLKSLLKRGANVDEQTSDNGRSALHEACRGEGFDEEKIKVLLSARADLHARDFKGQTVLHILASTDRVQPTEMFLRKGVDANVADDEGVTALLAAARSRQADELLPLLMKHGADVFAKDNYGRNALHHLAEVPNKQHTDLARVLVEKGVSLDDRDCRNQYQPIHLASRVGNSELVKLFLDHGADVNARANDRFPLYLAVDSSSYRTDTVVQTLLNRGAKVAMVTSTGRTALHEACTDRCSADVRKMKMLMFAGADMLIEDYDEELPRTPLDILYGSCRGVRNPFVELALKALALKKVCLPSTELMDEASIQRYPGFWSYYRDCVEQLERTKLVRFFKTCTFFELLERCHCQIAALMRNPEFEINFRNYDVTEFLMFAEDILEAFESAEEHYHSVLKQEDLIAVAVHDILPHMIVRKVTRYIFNCENLKHRSRLNTF